MRITRYSERHLRRDLMCKLREATTIRNRARCILLLRMMRGQSAATQSPRLVAEWRKINGTWERV